ncbi:MAG: hypothetical protein H6Q74_3035 [Firmicutes bacterium]|nr:hypothetical protein [Bacillota bacterium]
MDNGEFDNLPGKGKPLDLDDGKSVSPELRAAYKILKNSGMLPQEMSLKKELAILEKLMSQAKNSEEKDSLQKKLQNKTLMYSILMDKRKKR